MYDDLRRGGVPAIDAFGDAAVKQNLHDSLAGSVALDRDGYLSALQQRLAISRAWSLFLQHHPVLLMRVCWQRQFAIDEDTHDALGMHRLIRAQSPLLGTAMMGLPGLCQCRLACLPVCPLAHNW